MKTISSLVKQISFEVTIIGISLLTIGPLRLANNEVEAGVKTGPNIGCVRTKNRE